MSSNDINNINNSSNISKSKNAAAALTTLLNVYLTKSMSVLRPSCRHNRISASVEFFTGKPSGRVTMWIN